MTLLVVVLGVVALRLFGPVVLRRRDSVSDRGRVSP